MDQRHASAEPAERGFTLVELLVVIAILALLVAMLSPALRNAVEAAKSAHCRASLHQVGTAFIGYVQKYDGFLPSHDDEPGLTFDVWGRRMHWRFAHGQLVDVMDAHAVFRCPSDPTANPVLGARKWFSYTWNTRSGHFNHTTKQYRHRPMAQCTAPSRIIIFLDGAEGDGGTDGNDDRPYQPGGVLPYFDFTRHSGGFNALFVDGQVRGFFLGETGDRNYNW